MTEKHGWLAPMLDEMTFSTFRDLGRDIFLRGLISSHAGNMSIRQGQNIFITRRASMLGRLREGDIIAINIPKKTITLNVSPVELEKRQAKFRPRRPAIKSGYLVRYAGLVTSASTGAILRD